MKILLEIPDDKANSLLEMLRNISYVKANLITDEKALLLHEVKEAVEEYKLIRKGELKGISAKELLDGL